MKRFLVTILSILYMASALSLTVHVHYCMGRLASVSFNHSDEDRCGKCGMKKTERSKNCCKDDYKTFKANDHQQAKASFDFSHKQIAGAILPSYFLSSEFAISQYRDRKIIAYAPPLVRRTCPIYILVRDFRI